MRLPATRQYQQIARVIVGVIGFDHFANGAAFHEGVDGHRRDIGRAVVHASAHVRVQRQEAIAYQDLIVAGRRDGDVFDTEVVGAGFTLRARGQHDAAVGKGCHGEFLAKRPRMHGTPSRQSGWARRCKGV